MILRFDFPFFLTLATAITGVVYALDRWCWGRDAKHGVFLFKLIDWSRSFFPILLLVWGIRSFVAQPYRVPSGSLEPTILQGDFLLATQYNYGVFFPVGHVKLLSIGKPRIGDIVLFYPPEQAHNPSLFVKRVVALPGDHVIYRHKQLIVNGQLARQKVIGPAVDYLWAGDHWVALPAQEREENLFGIKHRILVSDQSDEEQPDIDVVVPKGHYFMMGDNRDFSDDSRFWGSVPSANLVGKAWRIVMSWDPFDANASWYRLDQKIRWHRLGTHL